MLQGPHGPFFAQLAAALEATGASVHRVGFNAGDQFFWRRSDRYIPFQMPLDTWPEELGFLLSEHAITDIVLYGDTRPVHATAIAQARARGICVHVFEEGYLRPYWITYERGGSNGHSQLCDMSVAQMRARLPAGGIGVQAPDHWGALRHHVFYGALYHFCILVGNKAYRRVSGHRAISVSAEFRLYLLKLLKLPYHAIRRRRAQRRITGGGYSYHLVLLQLAHDANLLAHSPFADMQDFVETVIRGFARGAPGHHHLVFKAHPLDDGRINLRKMVSESAKSHGIADRVHFLGGGKLGKLLDPATSCVTVNSTAAQQALWRGLPLRAFGNSVYSKPEFVSNQPLTSFFAQPAGPDQLAYQDYRNFLLATSQLPGNYYAGSGRRQVLRRVVDAILAPHDPYEMPKPDQTDAARAQHIGIVN